MKTVSLKLSDGLDAKLGLAATSRGQSKSAVVRAALKAFLENGAAGGGGSCLHLAADLAGCVEGPRDLSFDKKHLDGYGR